MNEKEVLSALRNSASIVSPMGNPFAKESIFSNINGMIISYKINMQSADSNGEFNDVYLGFKDEKLDYVSIEFRKKRSRMLLHI